MDVFLVLKVMKQYLHQIQVIRLTTVCSGFFGQDKTFIKTTGNGVKNSLNS